MITLYPKEAKELEGCRGFDFEINQKWHEKTRTRGDQENQITHISEIRTQLELLKMFPCEFDIAISVSKGIIISQGSIRVYGLGALRRIEYILSVVARMVRSRYPQSFFVLTMNQTVQITNIYR